MQTVCETFSAVVPESFSPGAGVFFRYENMVVVCREGEPGEYDIIGMIDTK